MLHLYAMFSACVAVATSPVNGALLALLGLSTGAASVPCLAACHDLIQRRNSSNRVSCRGLSESPDRSNKSYYTPDQSHLAKPVLLTTLYDPQILSDLALAGMWWHSYR